MNRAIQFATVTIAIVALFFCIDLVSSTPNVPSILTFGQHSAHGHTPTTFRPIIGGKQYSIPQTWSPQPSQEQSGQTSASAPFNVLSRSVSIPHDILSEQYPNTHCDDCVSLYLVQLKPSLNHPQTLQVIETEIAPYRVISRLSSSLYVITGPVNPFEQLVSDTVGTMSSMFSHTEPNEPASTSSTGSSSFTTSDHHVVDLLSLSLDDIDKFISLAFSSRSKNNADPIQPAQILHTGMTLLSFFRNIANIPAIMGLSHFTAQMKFHPTLSSSLIQRYSTPENDALAQDLPATEDALMQCLQLHLRSKLLGDRVNDDEFHRPTSVYDVRTDAYLDQHHDAYIQHLLGRFSTSSSSSPSPSSPTSAFFAGIQSSNQNINFHNQYTRPVTSSYSNMNMNTQTPSVVNKTSSILDLFTILSTNYNSIAPNSAYPAGASLSSPDVCHDLTQQWLCLQQHTECFHTVPVARQSTSTSNTDDIVDTRPTRLRVDILYSQSAQQQQEQQQKRRHQKSKSSSRHGSSGNSDFHVEITPELVSQHIHAHPACHGVLLATNSFTNREVEGHQNSSFLIAFPPVVMNANRQIMRDEIDQCIHAIVQHPWVVHIAHHPYLSTLNNKAKYLLQDRSFSSLKFWSRGLTGKDQIVMVSDTGVDYDHCMFYDAEHPTRDHIGKLTGTHPNYNQRKIIWYITTWGDDHDDSRGHGTHVAGTIAGNVQWTDITRQNELTPYNGHGLDTKLIVVDFKRTNRNELNVPDNLYTAMFAPISTTVFNATISSHSWGGDTTYSSYSLNVDSFVWENPFHLPVFAAGNNGEKGYHSVLSPGNSKNVLTVGATANLDNMPAVSFQLEQYDTSQKIPVQSFVDFSAQYVISAFTPDLSASLFTSGTVLLFAPGTNSEACSTFVSNDEENIYSGKIVIAIRGTCSFLTKATNAFYAGAKALVVINNDIGQPFVMGADAGVPLPNFDTFSALMISQANGKKLIDYYQASATASITSTASSGVLDVLQHSYFATTTATASHSTTTAATTTTTTTSTTTPSSLSSSSVARSSTYSKPSTVSATTVNSARYVAAYPEPTQTRTFIPVTLVGPIEYLGSSGYSHALADFSSRGPTIDGRVKPDLVAPGKLIYSSQSNGVVGTPNCPAPSAGGVMSLSGTSMATPAVSGSLSIMRQYFEQGYYANYMSQLVQQAAADFAAADPMNAYRAVAADTLQELLEESASSSSASPVSSHHSVANVEETRQHVYNFFRLAAAGVKAVAIASVQDVGGSVTTHPSTRVSYSERVQKAPLSPFQGWGMFNLDRILSFSDEGVSAQSRLSAAKMSSPLSPFHANVQQPSIQAESDILTLMGDPFNRLYIFDALAEDVQSLRYLFQTKEYDHANVPSAAATHIKQQRTKSSIDTDGDKLFTQDKLPETIEKFFSSTQRKQASSPNATTYVTTPHSYVLSNSNNFDADRCRPVSSSQSDKLPDNELFSCALTPHSLHSHCLILFAQDIAHVAEYYFSLGGSPAPSAVRRTVAMNTPEASFPLFFVDLIFAGWTTSLTPYEYNPPVARATLVWTDPPGSLQQQHVLVNNLDLSLLGRSTALIYVNQTHIARLSSRSDISFDLTSAVEIDWSAYRVLFPQLFAATDRILRNNGIDMQTANGQLIGSLLHNTNEQIFRFGNNITSSSSGDHFIADKVNNVEQAAIGLQDINLNAYIIVAAMELGLTVDLSALIQSQELSTNLQHYALVTSGALPGGLSIPSWQRLNRIQSTLSSSTVPTSVATSPGAAATGPSAPVSTISTSGSGVTLPSSVAPSASLTPTIATTTASTTTTTTPSASSSPSSTPNGQQSQFASQFRSFAVSSGRLASDLNLTAASSGSTSGPLSASGSSTSSLSSSVPSSLSSLAPSTAVSTASSAISSSSSSPSSLKSSKTPQTSSSLSSSSPSAHQLLNYGTCLPTTLASLCPNACNAALNPDNQCVNGQCVCGTRLHTAPNGIYSRGNYTVQFAGTDCSVEATVAATPCDSKNNKCEAADSYSTPLSAPITTTIEPWAWHYYSIPSSVLFNALALPLYNTTNTAEPSGSVTLPANATLPLGVATDTVYIGVKFIVSKTASATTYQKGDPDLYIATSGQVPSLTSYQHANRNCDTCSLSASTQATRFSLPSPWEPAATASSATTSWSTQSADTTSAQWPAHHILASLPALDDDDILSPASSHPFNRFAAGMRRYEQHLEQLDQQQEPHVIISSASSSSSSSSSSMHIQNQLAGAQLDASFPTNPVQSKSSRTTSKTRIRTADTSSTLLPEQLQNDKNTIWIDGRELDQATGQTITVGIYGYCCYETQYTLSLHAIHVATRDFVPDEPSSLPSGDLKWEIIILISLLCMLIITVVLCLFLMVSPLHRKALLPRWIAQLGCTQSLCGVTPQDEEVAANETGGAAGAAAASVTTTPSVTAESSTPRTLIRNTISVVGAPFMMLGGMFQWLLLRLQYSRIVRDGTATDELSTLEHANAMDDDIDSLQTPNHSKKHKAQKHLRINSGGYANFDQNDDHLQHDDDDDDVDDDGLYSNDTNAQIQPPPMSAKTLHSSTTTTSSQHHNTSTTAPPPPYPGNNFDIEKDPLNNL